MRHVDDGTLHAWLDGELAHRATAAWVEEHLRHCAGCAGRLAEARATIAQADALLSRAAPDAGTPAFEDLVERAGGSQASGGRPARWLMPATWAASLALAAVLGWTARDRATDFPPVEMRSAAEAPTGAVSRQPAANRPLDAGASESSESTAASAARAAVPQQPAASARREAATQSPAAASTPAAPPPSSRSSAQESPVSPDVQATRRQAAAPERAETDGPAQNGAADLVAPRPPAAVVAPAESQLAIAPGEAQALRESVPGSVPSVDVGAAATVRTVTGASRPSPTAAGGRVALDASTSAPLWRTVSRTEAAALTRMPLYGIDGLTPTVTAIDVRGSAVRTVYQLPSGTSVELVQQPLKGRTPGLLFTQPAQALAEAGAPGAEAAVARAARWSGVRGNARLTLRALSGDEDVAALGTRLRLD